MRNTAEQLRADARGNRDQILRAALEVFCERGTQVPMKDIADRAGVGVGTLYRRFPDRESLIIATSLAHLEMVAELVAAAWRTEPTAWAALGRILREGARLRLGAQATALEPATHLMVQADPVVIEQRGQLLELVGRMIAQAQADGDLRTDFGVPDVEALMTLQIFVRKAETYEQAVDRVVSLVLDGLRPQGSAATGRE
ncbi:TetR/AcrR family transcriptional regulator [Nocardia yamanashiensis]|uniref:TetR/AcrR family transcriptional regulator n=1 Tax=Nocardia yamanashiensis TaxID=209247 RepID=UPI001E4A5EFD|nr:TetR/AcrR family transcriptional regulator [Nocardia yamanashiensis]UGT42109.1 TetR/AcrR family transcriptional regulator [Nocardia yamanashiensis]